MKKRGISLCPSPLIFLTIIASAIALPSKAATFSVTNVADNIATANSLRWAVDQANSTAGPDTIEFSGMPGAGPYEIPTATLLWINDTVYIDGSTAPGYTLNTPMVVLAGTGAQAGIEYHTTSGYSHINGIVLNGFSGHGILVAGWEGTRDITIEGCFIGTSAQGTSAIAITGSGIVLNNSGGNTLLNNIVSGCTDFGVFEYNQNDGNEYYGNIIGNDVTGTIPLPNGNHGILLTGATNTIIGSSVLTPGLANNLNLGNRISGNGGSGIVITDFTGTASTNITIQANRIGVGQAGVSAMANNHGIEINAAQNVIIDQNLISGNNAHGIVMYQGGTVLLDDFTITGNRIGCSLSAYTDLGNGLSGIEMSAVSNVTIGGSTLEEGNVLFGNTNFGIFANGATGVGISNISVLGNILSANDQDGAYFSQIDDLIFRGNKVGFDETGMMDYGNGVDGLEIVGCQNAIIGGTTPTTRNYFGWNGDHGVRVEDAAGVGSDGLRFFGNFCGIAADGVTDAGNANDEWKAGAGLALYDSENLRIGGLTRDSANVCSGNGDVGIRLEYVDNTTIIGNLLGTDSTGTIAVPNNAAGIFARSSDNITIGGTEAGAGNIISGNGDITNAPVGELSDGGISVWDNNTDVSTGWTIQGNHIGVDITGNNALSNDQHGIVLSSGPTDFAIGGDTEAARNIISANLVDGIKLYQTDQITIQGNYIGTDVTGLVAMGNGSIGVHSTESNTNLTVGGIDASEGNVIAASGAEAIYTSYGSNNGEIGYNLIGTNKDGLGDTTQFGSGATGIKVVGGNPGATTSTIAIHNNLIAASGREIGTIGSGSGIEIRGSSAADEGVDGVTITENVIGFLADGSSAGSQEHGIYVVDNNSNVVIGQPGAGNVVGNGASHGLNIEHSDGVTIQGNYLGIGPDGESDAGNAQSGILVLFSSNHQIGGESVGAGNVIGFNNDHGVHQVGGGNNTYYGNYFGVTANWPNDTIPASNDQGNIHILGVNDGINFGNGIGNIIGGPLTGQSNVIAYSSGIGAENGMGNGYGIGIDALDAMGNLNLISQNQIFCNAGMGIDLNFSGSFNGGIAEGNDAYAAPSIDPYSTSANTNGTAVAGDTIEVFANPSGCGCEGEQFLGKTVADVNGDWTLAHASVADSSSITAIAINTNNNTSEFSSCCRSAAGTLEGIYSGTMACTTDQEIRLNNVVGEQIEWEVNDGSGFSTTSISTTFDANDDVVVDLGLSAGDYTIRAVVTTLSQEGEACSVTSNEISVSVAAGPVATITAQSPVCQGDHIAVEVSTSNIDSVKWTVVRGDGTLLDDKAENTTYSATGNETDSIIVALVAYGPCVNIEDTLVVNINDLPTATAAVVVEELCESDLAEVEFNASAGTAPYSISYTIGANSGNLTNVDADSTIAFNLNGNTAILVGTVTDANDCSFDLNATLNYSPMTDIEVSNKEETCGGTNLDYTLMFDISNGDNASYSVTGAAGDLVGTTWTSDPIDNGVSYTITVTDAFDCAPVVITGSMDCACVTAISGMNGSFEACTGEPIDWSSAIDVNTDFTNDGDDVVEFVLHTAANDVIGSQISTLTDFNLAENTLSLDTDYFISAIAGTDAGDGTPDYNDGCLDIAGPITVRFNSNPVINLSDETACSGASVSFDAGSHNAYLWSDGSSNNPLTYIPTESEAVEVTVTNNVGCTATASANATVFSLPEPAFGDDAEICEGSRAVLQAGTFAAYNWSTGESTASIEVNEAGTYEVTVTNNEGCSAPAATVVTIRPDATVEFTLPNSEICPGTDLNFNLNISQSGGTTFDASIAYDGINFTQFTGLTTGDNPITIGPDHELYPGSSSVFTVQLTDAAGCDQTPDAGNQVNVQVKASPSLTVEDLTVCSDDDPNDLVFTLLGGSSYDLYLTLDGVQSVYGDIAGPEFILESPNTGTYLIDSLVADNGCRRHPIGIVDVTVSNNPVATATFEPKITPTCEGVKLSITDVSNADSYLWDFGAQGTSTEQYPDPVFFSSLENVTASLQVMSSTGCADERTIDSTSISLFTGEHTIPTVFTPGTGDNLNDVLTLDPNDFYDGCILFTVYNRWGEEIFDNNENPAIEVWDGSAKSGGNAPEGTYYYIYSVGESEMEPMFVTLFRD